MGQIQGKVLNGSLYGLSRDAMPQKPSWKLNSKICSKCKNNFQESWRQQFTSFPGGVGNYINLPIYGGSVVYTECFSIAKIPNGYAVACGQGMETEEGGGVQGDPRGDWRGTAVGVDMDGAMIW